MLELRSYDNSFEYIGLSPEDISGFKLKANNKKDLISEIQAIKIERNQKNQRKVVKV